MNILKKSTILAMAIPMLAAISPAIVQADGLDGNRYDLEKRYKSEISAAKAYLESSAQNAVIIDVTSKGEMPMVRFSPFYPIGNIPIPFSPNRFSQSVEGIWQGLKVFEKSDVDESKFEITTMKGLKRTVRKFGIPKGHKKGINGSELLDYITARKLIYLPAYKWVLDNELKVPSFFILSIIAIFLTAFLIVTKLVNIPPGHLSVM